MLSKIYYKHKLKSFIAKLQVERAFVNVNEVSSLMVAIECSDVLELCELERKLNEILKVIPKVSYLVYVNTKKIEENAQLFAMQNIILCNNDKSWGGVPKTDVVERLQQINVDVFVNLNRKESLLIDFLTQVVNAKMRVGYVDKSSITELQIEVREENSYAEFFEKMLYIFERFNVKK